MTHLIRLSTSLWCLVLTGCYAPLCSPGIPASSLPDSFRFPAKALGVDINYAMLTLQAPSNYQLGSNDLIKVEIADLFPRDRQPLPKGADRGDKQYSHIVETRIDERGEILLPLVGSVRVGDLTLEEARQKVVAAYAKGILDNPKVAITVVEKAVTRVMVLGNVTRPGVYELPRFENDVAHAIASAGGLIEEKADEIQVHRKTGLGMIPPCWNGPVNSLPAPGANPTGSEEVLPKPREIQPGSSALKLGGPIVGDQTMATLGQPNEVRPHEVRFYGGPPGMLNAEQQLSVLRIPLRSTPSIMISPDQAALNDEDIVVVRSYPDPVFFVVGKLSENNTVRFNVGRENRDLGNGFVLPKDRDVDVITAVAMAGYIDPIDSPTTVTIHRTDLTGRPMLIRVDLIAARYDRKENIMVQAGDIIYLNPDAWWWFRRTFDRVVPTLIEAPYIELMKRLINPRGVNN